MGLRGAAAGFQSGFQLGEQARTNAFEREQTRQDTQQQADEARVEQVRNTLDSLRSSRDEIMNEATDVIARTETPEQSEQAMNTFRRQFQALAMQEANIKDEMQVAAQQSGSEIPTGVADSQDWINRQLERFDQVVGSTLTATEERQQMVADTRAEAQAQAEGTAAGTPEDPRVVSNDVDVVLDDGTRVPAVGQTQGDQLMVADQQGNFRPLQEVFPNAVDVQQARERTQQMTQEFEPFTKDEFIVANQPLWQERTQGGEAVGPVDAAAGAMIGVPGISQVFQELGGEDAGEAERFARNAFEHLSNRVLAAFSPTDDGRITNAMMEEARRLVPDFGAFSSEPGTYQDLRLLRESADDMMERELQTLNRQFERFAEPDQTLVRDAQERLQDLGEITTMTEGLMQSMEQQPNLLARDAFGKPVSELREADIRGADADTFSNINGETAGYIYDNLDPVMQRVFRERLDELAPAQQDQQQQ